MKLWADTHLHLYPFYDPGRALRSLRDGLRAMGAGSDRMGGFLAERSDCHWFRESVMRGGGMLAPGVVLKNVPVPGSMEVRVDGSDSLWLFAGRQVVTRERIEVLVLLVDLDIEDGLPADTVIARALEAGGVPVLSWAFGKWFGQRGKRVRELFCRWHSQGLVLGDSSLRPAGFPGSPLFREARRLGVPVLAGTDPLPWRGEESRCGRYASRFPVTDFEADPVRAVREAIACRPADLPALGRRCSLPAVLRRVLR